MRVVCFIDGFNIYYSMNDKKRLRHKYKWLDLRALTQSFLDEGDVLEEVLYFTAYTWNPEKERRHKAYVAALSKHGVRTVPGNFQRVKKQFIKGKTRVIETTMPKIFRWLLPRYLQFRTFEEKESDVNLSVYLVDYAHRNIFDKAIIISGDSDIKPAVSMVRNRFPEKNVLFAFPINRYSRDLESLSGTEAKRITIEDLQNSQLPDVIRIDESLTVRRPPQWN